MHEVMRVVHAIYDCRRPLRDWIDGVGAAVLGILPSDGGVVVWASDGPDEQTCQKIGQTIQPSEVSLEALAREVTSLRTGHPAHLPNGLVCMPGPSVSSFGLDESHRSGRTLSGHWRGPRLIASLEVDTWVALAVLGSPPRPATHKLYVEIANHLTCGLRLRSFFRGTLQRSALRVTRQAELAPEVDSTKTAVARAGGRAEESSARGFDPGSERPSTAPPAHFVAHCSERRLSPRQQHILAMRVAGEPLKRIADQARCSIATVSHDLRIALQRIGARTIHELALARAASEELRAAPPDGEAHVLWIAGSSVSPDP